MEQYMFTRSTKLCFSLMLCTVLFSATPGLAADGPMAAQSSETPLVAIMINDKTVQVEYAVTFAQRAVGLMNRPSLCQQCGMLFKFANPKMASMWMKNTLIPLDVAFIRSDGVITDISPLQPHDLTSVGASENVLYALEMNQGWFTKNGIAVGDTLHIQP
ncbi:MAG: uncharacterized membrane protein (UPF0127 family) [Paraglaciecola sp.]|jgi:uncharacterized membrane protein (UPF0127 family)